MSEDCLYLNVIRPHAVSVSAKLPIVVFLHGGGFSGGSASESRCNLSYIVDRSTELSQPILAVSFNYRLSAWGFIYSNEVRDTGATNIGLRDQRFALAWIQEKVAGFGGDPAKVTLWDRTSVHLVLDSRSRRTKAAMIVFCALPSWKAETRRPRRD